MRICSLLALLFLATVANALPDPVAKDGKVTISLTLSPAPLPKPLSRFYLTPQYKEMQPGNRVSTYMKAWMEQAAFFSKEPALERNKWNEMPLADLPLDEMKKSKSANLGGLAYRGDREAIVLDKEGLVDFAPTDRPLSDVDEASRQLTSDWQIWFNIRRDGIGTLLPEVQKMRELASVLNVRMRYEIATKNFEKAAYSARTFFGLAQSFETHPTLIASLVGLAVEAICLHALEEMIQQPGCPNLYWSFTEIPAEGLSLRTAIQGEKLLAMTLFGKLLQAGDEIPDADLKKILTQIDTYMVISRGSKELLKSSVIFQGWAKDGQRVERARTFLIETGSRADTVKKYSPLQAIVTADARQYEVDLDNSLRVFDLPNPDAQKLANEYETALAKDGTGILSAAILPPANKVRQTKVRLQQRVAYLRVIEAIRLHAQDNAGKLPAQLADIKLPIPLDPVTFKAFEYSVKDGKATLTGGNPIPGQANTNRIYEIAIRK